MRHGKRIQNRGGGDTVHIRVKNRENINLPKRNGIYKKKIREF